MSPRGARTAKGGPTEALQHWRKALRFREAALHDRDGGHWEACCSSAVLGAIHVASAISLHYRGLRSASQNHEDAVELVSQISEMEPGARARFVRHLDALLDIKSLVQYSSRAYGRADADAAIQHLDRGIASVQTIAERAGW